MIPPQTQQVLDFLGDPASYDHRPGQVTLHQTHASWVFVASPYVYKIKKPVDFGFMNFTTLDHRKANCEREVALNRRLTEDIYLGVEAICLRDGQLHFGKADEKVGEIVEWAVKMREMDSCDFLSHRIRENRLEPSDLDRLIERLVEFYRQQSPLGSVKARAAAAQMPKNIAANYAVARRFIPDCASKAAIDAIEAFTAHFEAARADLLASRPASGMIRDCHGDLHLEHIHISQGAINIYDCIEFNTEFREIDIACDIAFLAMDLDFNHRVSEAKQIVQQVAEKLGDSAMPLLVDYYKCYRACVRGKVEALTSAEEERDENERRTSISKSNSYFRLALRYALTGSNSVAFVFMGQVGSGKSTLASALGSETGWLQFGSDPIRKDLAGVPLTTRGTPEQRRSLYSDEITKQVYAKLANSAFTRLRRGQCVIIDATFSRQSHRDDFRTKLAAEGFAICWIEATAQPETIRARLKARENATDVISDAREEDLPMLSSRYEPPSEIPPEDRIVQATDAEQNEVLQSLLKEISRRYSASASL